jgi:serine/threonine-protein kinase
VLFRGIFARYARTGHLVYITSEGTLMAVPFDQDRMEVTGDPVALGDGIGVRVGGGAVDLALSASGTLWYAAGGVGSAGTSEAVWVTRDGQATPIPGVTGLLSDPALSPDGKRLAVNIRDLTSHILIKELDQGRSRGSRREEATIGGQPGWRMADRSRSCLNRSPPMPIATSTSASPTAAGRRHCCLTRISTVDEVAFSRDGAWLVYRSGTSPGARNIYARRLGTDSSIAVAATSADEMAPALSPDGRWLAYVSNESGAFEVYVRPFPNTADGRWQISTQGGLEPVWAHSGRELFYRTTGAVTDTQMVMAVTSGGTFVPGARRALFPLGRYATDDTHQQYAVAPDGRRFLMIRGTQADRNEQLVVVEHFFEVLRARASRP